MIQRLLFIIPFVLACLSLDAKPDALFFDPEDTSQIIVNNRILAKINGKPISVFDLVKKMDMLFYRQFPEYVSSTNARYQFYKTNWKAVLQELIDKELVLADAEENKFLVNNGDVRQEMESLFGPNIIANLDKVGMSFEEAWKIVHGDITIRRMIYIRVHNKALKQVTPQKIREAFESYSQKHTRPSEWVYQVISIRNRNEAKCCEVGNQAYQLLTNKEVSLKDLSEKLANKETSINVSDELAHRETELSDSYREILSQLEPNTFSRPISQKSRADRGSVTRLFYLKDVNAGGAPSFAESVNEIKDSLLDEIVGLETDLYLKRLRRHFAVKESVLKEMIPDDFQPFILKVSRF